jgi:inorganic pyrophosphatase
MDLQFIPIGKNPPKDVNAVIEIPLGGVPVKYELDKKSGALFVDRFLHTAMFYPGNYGFIPHTLSADGDPCDVLVIRQSPRNPVQRAAISCRP